MEEGPGSGQARHAGVKRDGPNQPLIQALKEMNRGRSELEEKIVSWTEAERAIEGKRWQVTQALRSDFDNAVEEAQEETNYWH